MSSIIVNGVTYGPATKAGPRPETVKQIVILQRGWIMVGDLSKEGTEFTLTDASVIRSWETGKGIGGVALSGPVPGVVLDPVGTARFHELTVVARLDVDESKW